MHLKNFAKYINGKKKFIDKWSLFVYVKEPAFSFVCFFTSIYLNELRQYDYGLCLCVNISFFTFQILK